jgi:hypothetical protein
MRWAGHVARTGENRKPYRILVEQTEEKRSLGRQRSKWIIILKRNLERWDGVIWTGVFWLRIGTSGGVL